MNDPSPTDYGDMPYSRQARIDALCDRFEAELKAGRRPRAEAFLELADQQSRAALVREMLHIEVDYRRAEADQVREEYATRFPDLGTEVQAALPPGHPPLSAGRYGAGFRSSGKSGPAAWGLSIRPTTRGFGGASP